jgi:hypothetical protein
MVRVGSDIFAAQSARLASARLQVLTVAKGLYRPAAHSTKAVDSVMFSGQTVQKAQPKTQWQNLNDAAKRTTKLGAILAGSLAGGLLGALVGCGLPGLIMGALAVGGVLSLRNLLKSSAPIAVPKQPEASSNNPFRLIDLAPVDSEAETVSPREQAKERLQNVHFEGTKLEPSVGETSKTPFGTVRFAGRERVVRNIVTGMMPQKYSVLHEERPTLKFRTLQHIKASKVGSARPDLLLNAPQHNVSDPMAVITLGNNFSKVQTFDAKNAALTSQMEAVVWSRGNEGHGL